MAIIEQAQNGIITIENAEVQEKTIIEWMEIFRKLYEDVDSKRSPIEMWVAATAHFSAIGEAIRRMHFSDLMYAAVHAFCWMCSFVLACNRTKGTVFALDESFSGIITCKYPLVCGHCQEKFCQCNPEKMDRGQNKAARYQDLLEERKGLASAPDTYKGCFNRPKLNADFCSKSKKCFKKMTLQLQDKPFRTS
jgi:hypothetical protein